MVKPAPCAVCKKRPVYGELVTGQRIQIARFMVFCELHGRVKGLTRVGTITRWNWQQWRSRRKSKGEATT